MARLQLNKSSLAREAAQLKTYEKFLPSLDLKRQQLMAERAKAVAAVRQLEAEMAAILDRVGETLPMLANTDIDLKGLVRLVGYETGTENVVGLKLPTVTEIEIAVAPYSPMARPHWVDDTARRLTEMVEARVRLHIAQERVAMLNKAVDTITQRVNLFDKVLIPTTRANIKKIRIYLSDGEMASVVRSKIAKRKRAAA